MRTGIIVAVGVMMLIVAVAPLGLLFYIGIVERFELANFDWTGVGSLAASITILINMLLLASVVVGFQSVREGQNSRTAEILRWAMEQMDKVKGDERSFRSFAQVPYAQWRDDPEALRSAQQVSNAYSRMAYFVNHQLIDISHFRKLWGVNICLYWLLLEEHILSERRKFGDHETAAAGAFVRSDFETLAGQLIEHFDRSSPGLLDGYLKTLGRTRRAPRHLAPLAA